MSSSRVAAADNVYPPTPGSVPAWQHRARLERRIHTLQWQAVDDSLKSVS